MATSRKTTVARESDRLLGRDVEVGRIEMCVKDAVAGFGATVVIEGEAGIGKTALLERAVEIGRAEGMRVVRGFAGEGECELPFGVIRQLFEVVAQRDADGDGPLLTGTAALARPVLLPGNDSPKSESGLLPEPYAALHGLYWVAANMASEAPLVLAIDDLHWSDPASIRFISYLARRISDLPAVLVISHRPGEGRYPQLGTDIAAAASSTTLRPRFLTAAECTTIIKARCGADAEAGFCEACHRATRGNPFLLHELVRSIVADGIGVGADQIDSIGDLSPAGVVRSVTDRLARTSTNAQRLAPAIALFDVADATIAADLAGLAGPAAQAAVDELVAAGLIVASPELGFAHPLQRAAVYSQIPALDRSDAHGRIVELLLARGESSEAAANHLLAVLPAEDPDVVHILRTAARRALERGAPETGVSYLRRALREPPSPDGRGAVLFELGQAEALLSAPEALDHLQEARDLVRDPIARIEVLRALAWASAANFGLWSAAESVAMQARELAEGRDPELELMLRGEQAAWLVFATRPLGPIGEMLEAAARVLDHDSPAGRAVLAPLSWCRMATGAPADTAIAAAKSALANGALIAEHGPSTMMSAEPSWTLACLHAGDELAPELEHALRIGPEVGSLHGFANHSSSAATLAYLNGDVADAEAYARDALRAMLEVSSVGAVGAASVVVDLLLEQDAAGAAQGELEALGMCGDLPPAYPSDLLLISRGRLKAVLGDRSGGLEDVLEAGRIRERWGFRSPAFGAWRSTAARIYWAMGDRDLAGELALEELEIVRGIDLSYLTGRALRIVGLCEGGVSGLAKQRDAVATLATSRARLDYARALVDLGVTLTREGRRATSGASSEAHELLSSGVDLAHRCGSKAVVARGQRALHGLGARPRSLRLSGAQSLTAAERRVARLAAQGMKNKEIAGALFVTLKTVEKHLSSAYSKLEIGSRQQLQLALQENHAGPAG